MSEMAIEGLVSQEEVDALILALLETRKGEGATEEEGEQLVNWIVSFRLDAVLFDMVLAGQVGIDIQEGDIVFVGLDREWNNGEQPNESGAA